MKKSLLSGLGLETLKETASPAPVSPELAVPEPTEPVSGLFIPLDNIEPDPNQPRKFSADVDEDLPLLADSILQHGILQPITVKALGGGKYQLISGERRWRAAKLALQSGTPCQRKGYDLKRIPVFIRDPESDTDRLEMQMVENLARADMSDQDIGRALQKLLDSTRVSKAELARRLGRSDTWVKAILAKSSTEAEAIAAKIGVPLDQIGTGEAMRMVSWSKDPEKKVVLDAIAAAIQEGHAFGRALIDAEEERYEILRRFPKLAGRADLTLDNLRTWQAMWKSDDPAQRAVAERVLQGATLAEAMQGPAVPAAQETAVQEPAVQGSDAMEEPEAIAPEEPEALQDEPDAADDEHEPDDAHTLEEQEASHGNEDFGEFEIDEAEAEDATAARAALSAEPVQPLFTPDERRAVDSAGLTMEAKGHVPVAEVENPGVVVRIPGNIVTQILQKAGIPDDLTVDQETVLRAIQSLL
ncbi:MAG: ParB/RepB/Spo0J family partition protein [Acidithiobacillus sp.]|nr:ParB/RepB/Spo0J family partition protein [Acidithiobacillus sp.]